MALAAFNTGLTDFASTTIALQAVDRALTQKPGWEQATLLKVEILGKQRPWDKIRFTRSILEETPYASEERLDDEIAEDDVSIDQEGFPGYRLLRERQFIKDGKVVKTNKWQVSYKPVTEYIRRGTNKSPDAKKSAAKDVHKLTPPKSTSASMEQ